MKVPLLVLCLVVLSAMLPSTAFADGPPPGTFNPVGNTPVVHVSVTTRPDGAYIEITVHQSVPGATDRRSPAAPTPGALAPVVPTPSTDATPSQPSQKNRFWSDATGVYEQTADGNLIYVTIPNFSSAIDWAAQLKSHPNQTPYTLYVNNQFQGIIWIANAPTTSSIRLGPPPAMQPVPGDPPAGNGSSTDPFQVALSLLDHVPLPNIRLKENPGLGLVNLPGWFWIAGYNGKPFGASQTVTIPPAVGANVPFSQVPANDPRRQPTSFTVSVRIWPNSYQWSFGDGAALDTQSIGQAYPAQSDIQHTYQYSSLHTAHGFPLQVTVTFSASYQVNGGAAIGLPAISHTYTANYPVQEAQSLLTSH